MNMAIVHQCKKVVQQCTRFAARTTFNLRSSTCLINTSSIPCNPSMPPEDPKMIPQTPIELKTKKKVNKTARYRSSKHLFPEDRAYQLTPRLLNTNVRGLVKRLPQVETVLNDHAVDFACLTETHCHRGVPDVDLYLSGFTLYRRDRSQGKGKGGGVACYVSNKLDSQRWLELNFKNVESLWLSVGKPGVADEIFLFGALYHPPQAPGKQLFAHISHCLDTMRKVHPEASIVLAGDFNRFKIQRLCLNYDLDQIVEEPTCRHRLLDKILTNRRDLYDKPIVLPEITGSDHKVVVTMPKSS